MMLSGQKVRPTGELSFEHVQGKTVITTAYSRYPLKFVSATRACQGACAWVYFLGYGGGAVCGDNVTVRCHVNQDCTAALTTQGSTKVYKRTARSRESRVLGCEVDCQRASQSLLARVCSGALLAMVPDPVTCFEDASFRQHQRFLLERGASLVLVDWITSGRMSRGEGWAFERLESRNEIMTQSLAEAERQGQAGTWEPLVLDSLVLEEIPGLSIRDRMLGMNVVGVVILVGPRVERAVSVLLQREARRRKRFPTGLEDPTKDTKDAKPERSSTEATGPAKGEVEHEDAKKVLTGKDKGRVLSSVSPLEGSGG
ncbi:unnamed protein product, partial [Ascophyllum nodosum]